MNYFILLSIFLFITTVVMSILWLKERRLRHLDVEKVKYIKLDLDTLREAFMSVSKTAEENQEKYKNTLELYSLTRNAYNDVKEDLDYAQAIITGDLSKL